MRKPTLLQKKTVEILKENPDMPVGKAMRQAGYSPNTSLAPTDNFLDLKGTVIAMDQWRDYLRGSGLNEKKIKDKMAQWLDAKKIQSSMTEPDRIVDDYQTQLKAGEMLRKDLGLSSDETIQQTNIQVIVTRGEDDTS